MPTSVNMCWLYVACLECNDICPIGSYACTYPLKSTQDLDIGRLSSDSCGLTMSICLFVQIEEKFQNSASGLHGYHALWIKMLSY